MRYGWLVFIIGVEMRLDLIREGACAVWNRTQRLVLFPEIMPHLIHGYRLPERNSLLEDQYSYIVNMFLIKDYLLYIKDRKSPTLKKDVSVIRVWGDFLNMMGLNIFFNYDSDSDFLKPEAISRANSYVNKIIQIVYSALMELNDENTTVKLFREGGDEIGGVIIVNGQINWPKIKAVVNKINDNAEKLTTQYGLNQLAYARDPSNSKRLGCGFLMLTRRVFDPSNSITQITLEHLVKSHKEKLGVKRLSKGLSLVHINTIDVAHRKKISKAIIDEEKMSRSAELLLQGGIPKRIRTSISTLPVESYQEGCVQGVYTTWLLSRNVGKTLIAIKFIKLKEINDAYSHIAADYAVMRLAQTISEERDRYLKDVDRTNVDIEVLQLRMLGMIVNSTIGIITENLSEEEIQKFIKRLEGKATEEFIQFSEKDYSNSGDKKSNLFVITIKKVTNPIGEFLHSVYIDLQKKEKNLLLLPKGNLIHYPMEYQFGQDGEYEPKWNHSSSIKFSHAASSYVNEVKWYMVSALISSVSNYGVNSFYAHKALNTKDALTALNIAYALQAGMINPTLGIASSAGKIMGEQATNGGPLTQIGNTFRIGLIINMPITILSMVGLYCSTYALPLLSVSPTVNDLIRDYFKFFIISIPAQLVQRFQTQSALATKNKLVSSGIGLAHSAINFGSVLLYLFALNMDINAVGLSMTTACWLSMILTFVYLGCSGQLSKIGLIKKEISHFRDVASSLFRLGLPYAAQMFIEQSASLVSSLMVAKMGDSASGALQITTRYAFPLKVVNFAAANNLSALIGRANGQDNFIKAKNLGWSALFFVNALFLVVELGLLIWPNLFAKPFLSADGEGVEGILSILPTLMRIQVSNMVLDNTRNLLEGALRGTGNTVVGLTANVLSMVIFLGFGAYLAFRSDFGVHGLYAARMLGLFLVNLFLYHQWQHRANYGVYPISGGTSTT